jgi:hypothetical protein
MLLSSSAFADGGAASGVTLFPSISIKQETGTIAGDQTNFHLDLRLGFITSSGWYFGFLYSRTNTIGSNGLDQFSYGNSVGYFYDALSIIATYHLTSASHESTATRTVNRTEGMGYQFDFSYMFPAAASFSIGPTLTYKVLNYGKEEDSGIILNHGVTETFIYPFFGMMFSF